MSNLDVIFKILLPRGSLIISLSFPQALSTELRVHWRGSMGRPEMESRPYEFLLHSNNTREDSTHGHHQMINTEIRLIIFFAAKDGEALHSQQKQDRELTVALIMNSLLPNSE